MTGRWRAMTAGDLPLVERIAEVVHPDYPESGEVPAERLSLFPAGCLIAENGQGAVLGYAVSHPGRLGRPPALDSLLGRISPDADCLYLHDVALLPEARGLGLGESLVDLLRALGCPVRLPPAGADGGQPLDILLETPGLLRLFGRWNASRQAGLLWRRRRLHDLGSLTANHIALRRGCFCQGTAIAVQRCDADPTGAHRAEAVL